MIFLFDNINRERESDRSFMTAGYAGSKDPEYIPENDYKNVLKNE